MKFVLLILTVVVLASCATSDEPDFTEMSQAELNAYNFTVAAEDRVYCADVQLNPAKLRMRYLCITAKEIQRESEDAAYRQERRDEYRPPYTGLSTP